MAKVTQVSDAPKGVKAWSWSVLQQYETCPKQTYYSKIQKVQVPKAPALEKGIKIHEELEACLRDHSLSCPELAQPVEVQLERLRMDGAIPELEIAFDKDWNACDWFAPNCWLRIKVDAIVPPTIDGDGRVHIIDWKSGKVRQDHTDYDAQLELYMLAALLMYPTAEQAEASLIFLEHGVVLDGDDVMTRDMIPAAKAKWENRVKPLLSDTTFAPRPSGFACRWCDLGKAAGCEYASKV